MNKLIEKMENIKKELDSLYEGKHPSLINAVNACLLIDFIMNTTQDHIDIRGELITNAERNILDMIYHCSTREKEDKENEA